MCSVMQDFCKGFQMQNEQVRDAATPEEMRSEIDRLRRESPLVHAVMRMADYSGSTAEDRYTALAYHALKEAAQAKALLIQRINSTPPDLLVTDAARYTRAG